MVWLGLWGALKSCRSAELLEKRLHYWKLISTHQNACNGDTFSKYETSYSAIILKSHKGKDEIER